MPITIKDIAKQAGVSHSTVSRALRNNPMISDQTTERIRQIAREMGYFPSAAARSLKTNRSQVLGVVLSSIDDPFFSEILQGIEDGIQGSGYSLFIASAYHNPIREKEIVQTMVEHRTDGVIICSTSFSEKQGGHFLEYGVPIVVINNQAAEDFRYSIYHDDADGARQLTHHLIELGHQRIAYLGNILSGRTNEDRLMGFRRAMSAANLEIPPGYILEACGGNPEDTKPALNQLLSVVDRPTALLCYNDMLAIGILRGLQEHQLQVPQDISVTGFDNIKLSAYTNPPITTFDQPKHFIGEEAARLLMGLLESSSPDKQNVKILKGRLLIRNSTAPPPGQARGMKKPLN
jgi:DNA-binding LacI/PurR family transcriptional regulator